MSSPGMRVELLVLVHAPRFSAGLLDYLNFTATGVQFDLHQKYLYTDPVSETQRGRREYFRCLVVSLPPSRNPVLSSPLNI